MKLNFGIKILAIALVLIASNFIYSLWYFEKDLQKYAPDINVIRRVVSEKADIVYCGESSNISTFKNDTSTLFISQILNALLPNQKVIDFTKKASHAGIFFQLLKAIHEPNNVKTIVVTMNLRSFGPDWINSNLETPLQKDLVLLRSFPPLVNRFLLGFKNYDTTPAKQREKKYKWHLDHDPLNRAKNFPYATASLWEESIVKNGNKRNKDLNTTGIRELASQYIKSYAFIINPETSPRIRDFNNIVELAKKRKWRLVFHILPENVERAEKLVGKELIQMMIENKNLLVNRYKKLGVKMIDNLELLPNEQYIDQDWTSEHYKEIGRLSIAKTIVEALLP